ncbi:GntR family transcriptional regulator [Rhizobium johnstonii]|uniref:GntR family transcriptional regulator n=1 Tax=Rhizobium johnstonii TaxID=3019933 RepID=UPI003F94BA0B
MTATETVIRKVANNPTRRAASALLPKEAKLMERFDVGPHSVGKALAQLQTRGLV